MRRGLAYDPFAHASELGLVVLERDLPGSQLGRYLHDSRTVWLERRLTERQARSTLAHEVQHALRDHVGLADPAAHARQEREAVDATALMLISPFEYMAVRAMHEDDGGRRVTYAGREWPARLLLVAQELNCSPRDVWAFERLLRRGEV